MEYHKHNQSAKEKAWIDEHLNKVDLPQDQMEDLYHKVHHALLDYEMNRQQALVHSFFNWVFWIGISVLGTYLTIEYWYELGENVMFPIMLLAGLSLYMGGYFSRRFKGKFKKDLIQIIMGQFGARVDVNAYPDIDEGDLAASKIFAKTDKYEVEDIVFGKYNGLKFRGYEIDAGKEVGFGNSKHTKRIFEGLFFTSQLSGNFNCKIQVKTKNFKFEDGSTAPTKEFDSLNPEFDNHFDVMYTDYDEASHFLSNEFMKGLLAFNEKHKWPFLIKVVNDRIYVAINEDVDFFELSVFNKVNNLEVFETLYNDCDFFFDMILLVQKIKRTS